MKYETKPQPVDAWQWTGKTQEEADEFAELAGVKSAVIRGETYRTQHLEITLPTGGKTLVFFKDWFETVDRLYYRTWPPEQFHKHHQAREA